MQLLDGRNNVFIGLTCSNLITGYQTTASLAFEPVCDRQLHSSPNDHSSVLLRLLCKEAAAVRSAPTTRPPHVLTPRSRRPPGVCNTNGQRGGWCWQLVLQTLGPARPARGGWPMRQATTAHKPSPHGSHLQSSCYSRYFYGFWQI